MSSHSKLNLFVKKKKKKKKYFFLLFFKANTLNKFTTNNKQKHSCIAAVLLEGYCLSNHKSNNRCTACLNNNENQYLFHC